MNRLLCLVSIFMLFGFENVLANTCDVYTYTQFVQCVSSNTTINLKSDIVLDVAQKITIKNIHNLRINGFNNGKKHVILENVSRFNHLSDLSDHYIYILNSSNITIENIIFKSGFAADQTCMHGGVYYNKPPCYADLSVRDSADIYIYNNDFLSQKTFQLAILDVDNLWVERNIFKNAATYGITAGSYAGNLRGVRIVNNNFELAGANGIMISGAHNAWIGNNKFLNNHRLTQFFGYGGGHIVLEDASDFPLSSLDITGNVIDGQGVSESHGIEFANFDRSELKNIQISWNRIVNNRGGAVVFENSGPASRTSNVKISNNEYLNNKNGSYFSQGRTKSFNDVNIDDNWNQSGTRSVIASFSETPKSCVLALGQSHCNINIQWNVDYQGKKPNVFITVRSVGSQIGTKNRGTFASGVLNGVQSAPWIDENGAIFELYEKSDYDRTNGWEAPLASIRLNAIR